MSTSASASSEVITPEQIFAMCGYRSLMPADLTERLLEWNKLIGDPLVIDVAAKLVNALAGLRLPLPSGAVWGAAAFVFNWVHRDSVAKVAFRATGEVEWQVKRPSGGTKQTNSWVGGRLEIPWWFEPQLRAVVLPPPTGRALISYSPAEPPRRKATPPRDPALPTLRSLVHKQLYAGAPRDMAGLLPWMRKHEPGERWVHATVQLGLRSWIWREARRKSQLAWRINQNRIFGTPRVYSRPVERTYQVSTTAEEMFMELEEERRA